jgi:hypothetical protein
VLISPLASTTFIGGSIYNITWISSSVMANVTITLQQRGQTVVYWTIAQNVKNVGYYSWPISVSIPTGQYWILVTTVNVSPSVYGAAPSMGSFQIQAGGSKSCFQELYACIIVHFSACTTYLACDDDQFCSAQQVCTACASCTSTTRPYPGTTSSRCPLRCTSSSLIGRIFPLLSLY